MRRILTGAFLLAAVTACHGSSLGPLPFLVTIGASRATAAPGDSIAFTVNAQGGELFGVEIDFGDGITDQYATSGARTARVTFKHAYDSSGVYTARAVVTDALAGQKEVSVDVTIN